jgi:membrane fusion protein, heavy metal efflux system
MNNRAFGQAGLAMVLVILPAGCNRIVKAKDARLEALAAPDVEHEADSSIVKVDHPERFPVATATAQAIAVDLNVTGVVSADVARNVPVVSMASGRILEIRARLGDKVTKGQVLMRVQSADIASAFSDYLQAVADQKLARAQLARSKILYGRGAIARKELEVVQETEEKADLAVKAAAERLQVLGADREHPTSIVDVAAPVSGVITDQQVTAASGTQGLASPNAFTISDLSQVWILCDVYENDLPLVQVGEYADIRLNAYPAMTLKGRIGNIGSILDPGTRTAKVRVEVENPGLMRLGMFVQATFHGPSKQVRGVVPASAILHLHDRDWVYVPKGSDTFRRVEVVSGRMVVAGRQEIVSGIRPGDRVVADALLLENSFEQ